MTRLKNFRDESKIQRSNFFFISSHRTLHLSYHNCNRNSRTRTGFFVVVCHPLYIVFLRFKPVSRLASPNHRASIHRSTKLFLNCGVTIKLDCCAVALAGEIISVRMLYHHCVSLFRASQSSSESNHRASIHRSTKLFLNCVVTIKLDCCAVALAGEIISVRMLYHHCVSLFRASQSSSESQPPSQHTPIHKIVS